MELAYTWSMYSVSSEISLNAVYEVADCYFIVTILIDTAIR